MAFGQVPVWICHKSFETWPDFCVKRVLYLCADFGMPVLSVAVARSNDVVSFAVVWLQAHGTHEVLLRGACCVAELLDAGAESVSAEERGNVRLELLQMVWVVHECGCIGWAISWRW